MIKVDAVSFAYPGDPLTGEKQEAGALRDVSLSAGPGELVCVAGANGSGKSTLLLLLAGLYAPNSGTVTVGPYTSPRQADKLRLVAALAMQDPDLQILGATVEEDLFLGRDPKDEQDKTAVSAMAKRFDMDQLMDRPVQALSHGQKRKLCLAAALLATGQGDEPISLLFDEPFSGLDYSAALEMRDMLRANQQAGHTQIVTSHDLEPIVDLADKVVVLHAGQVALSGAPGDVLDRVAQFGVRQPCAWQRDTSIEPWA